MARARSLDADERLAREKVETEQSLRQLRARRERFEAALETRRIGKSQGQIDVEDARSTAFAEAAALEAAEAGAAAEAAVVAQRARHGWPALELVFKCDDDTALHVDRLWQWWTAHGRPPYAGLVPPVAARTVVRPWAVRDPFERRLYAQKLGCDFWGGGDVDRCLPADAERLVVPERVWLAPWWPPFALGGTGYALSVEGVRRVVDALPQIHEPVHLEDVVVGIAATLAGLEPANAGAGRMLQRAPADAPPAAVIRRADHPVLSVHAVGAAGMGPAVRALLQPKREGCAPTRPTCTLAVLAAPSAAAAARACVRVRLRQPRALCLAWPFPHDAAAATVAQLAVALGMPLRAVEDAAIRESYAPEIATLLWKRSCRRRKRPNPTSVIVDSAANVARLRELCVCAEANASAGYGGAR